ncbi:hypothetical protein [Massilia sp. TN1-12]|uniref:hypothetical protein n=1 Tax=Massilia paldalensis TaxID=3377675 RepID=UPI00384EA40B
MTNTGIPELKDEINRKAFETVEFLYNGLDNGKLTAPQFSTGLDTLFMAVSGLVDRGVIDLITAGSDYVQENKAQLIAKRALYGADGTVVVLTRQLGADSFLVEIYRAGRRVKHEVKDYTLAKQATDAMNIMTDKLLAGGYAEL